MEKITILDTEYTIFFNGEIEENKINLIYKEEKQNLSQEAKNFIDKNWEKCLSKNNNWYDGDVYNLISVENKGNEINLYYNFTKFRHTLATRLDEYKKFIKEGNYYSNHIAIPTILITKDNKILIGSDLTFNKNNIKMWKLVGGYWEKEAKTITENVLKEIEEEIGKVKVENIKITLISSHANKSTITAKANIDMASKELEEYIKSHRNEAIDNQETAEIKFINYNKEELIKEIYNDKNGYINDLRLSLYSLL